MWYSSNIYPLRRCRIFFLPARVIVYVKGMPFHTGRNEQCLLFFLPPLAVKNYDYVKLELFFAIFYHKMQPVEHIGFRGAAVKIEE